MDAKRVLRWGWIAAFAFHAALGVWLAAHPVSLPSDDALFFARGIERFSILEFRPHFPGYPGFILLGKALRPFAASAEQALFVLSVVLAWLIPPAAALLARAAGAAAGAVLAAFAIAVTQPLLPLLGLSLMSDGAGILLLLLGLTALISSRWGLAGLLLGLCLSARPSFAVPVMAAIAWAFWTDPRLALRGLASGTAVCAVFFGTVLALEGGGYVEEAGRFLEGHFLVWGNTVAAQSTYRPAWHETLSGMPALLLAAVITGMGAVAALWKKEAHGLLLAVFAAAVLWTLLAQNPANVRHLAPVLILGGSLVGLQGARSGVFLKSALFLVQTAALLSATVFGPTAAPLDRAMAHLESLPPGIVVTNHGVQIARSRLDRHRVVDAFYTQSARSAERGSADYPVWRLTSTRPDPEPRKGVAEFPGRVPGEKSFWLIRVPNRAGE